MRSRVIRAGIENGTTDNIQPFFTLQLDIEVFSCKISLFICSREIRCINKNFSFITVLN